ncbi:high affinity copper uptake protein 1-like [Anticarsia gemmatalis]|uniref:high affinity copper uptake protein 1-like n=1 Tax=Anticarsia gemmatalis TaxID=129554 RepID=UPI003F775B58
MWGVERHHHDDDDPCGGHDHAMVFHSCVCAEILFNGWATTNAVQLFGSSVAIFVAAVLYEAFKCFREELTRKPGAAVGDSQLHIAKTEGGATGPTTAKASLLNTGHVIQTLMHFIQSTLSYMLMLIFMTYNVWLCLALVLGLTFGYFLFGWRRGAGALGDANEHCQ